MFSIDVQNKSDSVILPSISQSAFCMEIKLKILVFALLYTPHKDCLKYLSGCQTKTILKAICIFLQIGIVELITNIDEV
jgi:hypothetical protein